MSTCVSMCRRQHILVSLILSNTKPSGVLLILSSSKYITFSLSIPFCNFIALTSF